MQLPQTTPPSQSKDPDFRGKKVRAMKKWACAMVSGNTVQWSQPYTGDVRRGRIRQLRRAYRAENLPR